MSIKTPRDTTEFEKIETPNKTVAKSVNKVEKRFPAFYDNTGRYHDKINKNAPAVTGKDLDRYNHWKRHQGYTALYSMAHRNKENDLNLINDSDRLERGYKHYKENVNADKDLYDYLFKSTGGNGEH